MEELLREMIEKFNEKTTKDEKLSRQLKDIVRKVQVEIEDGENYSFLLEDGKIRDFSRGNVEGPDVKIISDTATIEALLKGNIGPMKALATRRLRIKASLEDLLRLRKLF